MGFPELGLWYWGKFGGVSCLARDYPMWSLSCSAGVCSHCWFTEAAVLWAVLCFFWSLWICDLRALLTSR